jgi:hypothetical protein
LGRRLHLPRCDERELVEQALGVLHGADDPMLDAADGPGVTELQMERRGHAARHGDLFSGRRVVPGDEREHRATEGPVRILGAELERVDRAGDRHGLVLDHLDAPEEMPEVRDLSPTCAFQLVKVAESPAVPKPKFADCGVFVATAEPTIVATTATTMRARIRNC